MNNIEIQSTPNLKLIKPSIQFFSSTNWNSDVVLSKENKSSIERKKFAREVKIAIYFEFFSTFFWLPVVIKMNIAPINGINIINERIGKFILI